MIAGPRSQLRISLFCNVVLIAIVILSQTRYLNLTHAIAERWVPFKGAALVPLQDVAVAQHPFAGRPLVGGSCSMCAVGPEICERLGEHGMLKALSFGGSGDRLRRLIARLRQGERLTLGVVGGSVSGGHGLFNAKGDLWNHNGNLNRIVFDHLDQLFPAPNGVIYEESGREDEKNSYINGAQGGMGTGYFSRCFMEHLPEDMNLIIIEQAINDEPLLMNTDNYEMLVRGLLDLPRQPAILNLQVFQLMFKQIFIGGDLHLGIAEYYDLPILSMRNAMIHDTFTNTSLIRELFHTQPGEWDDLSKTDLRHVGPVGHRIMGQIAIAYIDHIRCEMERSEAAQGLDPLTLDVDVVYPNPDLPRLLLTEQYNETKVFPKLEPQCFSTNSDKHPLVPAEGSKGWRQWNWENKHYLIADEPGSKISFHFSTKLGNVILFYLRSAKFGLGTAKCWVDDDEDVAHTIEGYWDLPYNIGRELTIRKDLAPGDHMLHCVLAETTKDPGGGHEFRIISLMAL